MNQQDCPVHTHTQVNLVPKSSYEQGLVKLHIDEYNASVGKHTKKEVIYNLNELFPTSTPVQKLVLGTIIRLGTFPTEFLETILTNGSTFCRDNDVDLSKANGSQFIRHVFSGFKGPTIINRIELIGGTIIFKTKNFYNETYLENSNLGLSQQFFEVFILETNQDYSKWIDLLQVAVDSKAITEKNCTKLIESIIEYKLVLRENIFYSAHTQNKTGEEALSGVLQKAQELLLNHISNVKAIWPGLNLSLNLEEIKVTVGKEIDTGVEFFKVIYDFLKDPQLIKNPKKYFEFDYGWQISLMDEGVVFISFQLNKNILYHDSIWLVPLEKVDGEIVYIPLTQFGTCPLFSNRYLNWKKISEDAKKLSEEG